MGYVGGPGFITPPGAASDTDTHQKMVSWTFTAPASGADIYEYIIPPDPAGNSATWNVRECEIRASVPSAGSTTFQIETSSGVGAFSAVNVLTSALTLTGSGTYEASTTSFAKTTLATGDKVRVNYSAVDATHDGIVISLSLGS